MSPKSRSPALPYAVAVVAAAASLLVRWPLWPLLGNSVPYMTFFPAVMLAAYLGGLGPGLLATALGAAGAVYFLLEPRYSFAIHTAADAAGVTLFVAVGAFLSAVCEELRRARRRAEEGPRRQTEEALKRTEGVLRLLAEAGELLASSLDYEATLASVARLAVPRLADWCSIYVPDEKGAPRQLAVAHADPTRVELAREVNRRWPPDPGSPRGLAGVLRSGRPELVPEITDAMLVAGARDPEHLELLRDLGVRSVMMVPLTARGRTLGVINFAATGRRYGPEDLAVAEDLARRAALAVDNARLYREAQGAAGQLSLLVEASARLTSSLEMPAVQSAILELSHRLIAADAYAIWRQRSEAGVWEVAQSAGLSETYLRTAGRISAPSTAMPRDPVVAEDAQGEAMLEPRREAYRAEGVASLMSIPLLIHGQVAGTLVFYYRTRRPFDPTTMRVATALANLAGAALGTAELYERESASRRRAEEADRRKDQFLALLGHELRNPLAPIRNAVHLLAMRPDDPAVVAQVRGVVGRQIAQLTRLVDELLDASRVARGKVQLRPERLDLAALVRTTAEDHRPELEAAGLALAIEAPDGPLWVAGDGARLRQVLGNLLHNAAKFTDRGGRVTVRLAREGGRAALAVEDTGVGIRAEVLPALFTAFSQAEATLDRARGGLGLGLSVVKGLVELHGGEVRAASDGPGRGACFTAWLPLDGTAESAPGPAAPAGASAGGPRRKVVVIEDGVDQAESLRLLLTLKGLQVAVARTGKEGVELARRERPDAVVCDLGLPGVSGYEVARALRADPATAGALLVCVSGYGQSQDRRKALEVGFDAALVKPVDPDVLLRVLSEPEK